MLLLGLDLGGSSVKGVMVTSAGQTLGSLQLDFQPERPGHWAETVRAVAARLAEQHGPPDRLGASAPGLAARDGRSIAVMPGRLAGLEGMDWTRFLGAAAPVPVLNDAHAALLGEGWLGAARGLQNAILLTLGTGVGGAILADGRLLRGAFGKAGHLGHLCLDMNAAPDLCGMPGSLELAIGNGTVTARSGGRFATTHALVAAHLAGDAGAAEVWLRSVRALACAIASFANILDPEAVIVGGGIARAGSALFEPLQRFLDEVEWRPGGGQVRLLPAALGELAGAYGAAARTLQPR